MSMELQTAGNPRKMAVHMGSPISHPNPPPIPIRFLHKTLDSMPEAHRPHNPRRVSGPESPVSFSALDDHIEVKLVLLLPVDHPIVLSFDSLLSLDGGEEKALEGELKPLSLASGKFAFFAGGKTMYRERRLQFFVFLWSD
nr:uncharacterized protein LOC114821336 [Malus domestica]